MKKDLANSEVVLGKRLKEVRLAIRKGDVPETDFGNLKATPKLGVFGFRADQ